MTIIPTITEIHRREFVVDLTQADVDRLIADAVRAACGLDADHEVEIDDSGERIRVTAVEIIEQAQTRPAEAASPSAATLGHKNQTQALSGPQDRSLTLSGDDERPRSALGDMRPWTIEEDALVMELSNRGFTASGIGERIWRTTKAVEKRRARLRKEAMTAKPGDDENPQDQPQPQENKADEAGLPVAEAQPEAASIQVEKINTGPAQAVAPATGLDLTDQPAWFREINAHLNALGNKSPWTPGADVALVESLMRGAPAEVISDELGVDIAAFRARFVALTPGCVDNYGRRRVTIEDQQRLLQVLRARAGA